MRQVVILHGWSDGSKSFEPLAGWLSSKGYQTVPLWLGDYISMQDDVGVEDVAKRMEAVLRSRMSSGIVAPEFDLIVHSTGGLVARRWIADHHAENISACPAKRLVMLAPANFGSPLAHLGQSMLGRLVKGWDHWFHTGKRTLKQLELASPFQWDLARRDLFALDGGKPGPIYGPGGIPALGDLLLEALACDTEAAYGDLVARWNGHCETTARLGREPQFRAQVFPGAGAIDEGFFHQYLQMVVRVVDDHGQEVGDYFLEFSGPGDDPGDQATVHFQQATLKDVHLYGDDKALRCLYLDRTDLMTGFYGAIATGVEKVLRMSLSANPPGKNVTYFKDSSTGARGSLTLHLEDEKDAGKRWLRRNTTHLVEVVIPRVPGAGVFKLKPFGA